MASRDTLESSPRTPAGMTSEVWRYFGASVVVVLLLTGGVYWLHRVPASSSASEAASSIQVRLLPTTDPTPFPLVAAHQPDGMSAEVRTTVPAEDPEDTLAEPEQTAPAPLVTEQRASEVARVAPSAANAATSEFALEFRRTLLRHIARFQRYPARARQRNLQGTVGVVFVLRRDGSVVDAWVTSTSGEPLLDQEALNTVRRSEPLPPIPGELPDQLNILLPVAFALP